MTFNKKKPIKILIVDDSDIVRQTTKDCLDRELTNLGYNPEIHIADDGTSAISSCKNNQYNIILMDMIMKKTGGEECIKKLRSMGNNSKIFIVTGYEDDDSITKCVDQKIVDENVFYKPVDFKIMAGFIKESF